ncbi:hypothetical protein NQZ68_033511 [Dissostichus eleginoides]|nr:hypothetical protein NQZ68_033511 [Dissostichus eleginoides]
MISDRVLANTEEDAGAVNPLYLFDKEEQLQDIEVYQPGRRIQPVTGYNIKNFQRRIRFGGEEYFQPRGPLKRPAYTQQRPKPGEQGAAEPECGVSASG